MFNAGTFSATDTTIVSRGDTGNVQAVTIQGLQGSGSFAHKISLVNSLVSTASLFFDGTPGKAQILLQANNIALNNSTLQSLVRNSAGGSITLLSKGDLNIQNSTFDTGNSNSGLAGTVDLTAGKSIEVTGTNIGASGASGGSITLDAPMSHCAIAHSALRGSFLVSSG